MKTKLQFCQKCNEETLHDIGKKQSGDRSGKHYITRTTMRCRNCGIKEINNRKKGRKIIKGTNLQPKLKLKEKR